MTGGETVFPVLQVLQPGQQVSIRLIVSIKYTQLCYASHPPCVDLGSRVLLVRMRPGVTGVDEDEGSHLAAAVTVTGVLPAFHISQCYRCRYYGESRR